MINTERPGRVPSTTRMAGPPLGSTAVEDATIKTVYRADARAAYRHLLRLTFGRGHPAEDRWGKALVRASRKISGIGGVGPLRPWHYTVARRIAIDDRPAREARMARLRRLDAASASAPASDAVLTGARQVIRQAIILLTDEQRIVVVEIYFRKRSNTEVAASLGEPCDRVKALAHSSLRALHAAFGASSLRRRCYQLTAASPTAETDSARVLELGEPTVVTGT